MIWYFHTNMYSLARGGYPVGVMASGVSAKNVQIACCAPSIYFS
jgi:hypothetical protein